MDLFSELITAVQSDLTVGDESTLFPLPTIKLAINRAYRKGAGLHRWAETEDAKKTSTQADTEYYDYPQNWRADSIWKLQIDGVDYGDPVIFKDYLHEKENNIPSGLNYLWANQWRRFFVYPTPTSAGDYNISVWGIRIVDELVNDADVTIWSYSMPECNEALVLEAVAILKNKGEEEKTGIFRSIEARAILDGAWKKIVQEQAKYEKTQPFFDVPDFFGNGANDRKEGNF
jgi:hypothetical protein